MPKKITDQSVNGDAEYSEEFIEGQFEDVSGLQGDLDEQMDAIFADIGGTDDAAEFSIRVYRNQEGRGKLAYLFSCLPSELPLLDRLRDDYSGGDFEVRVLKSNRIFRRRNVCVEPPPKIKTPVVDPTHQISGIATVMSEGFVRLGELIVSQNNQRQDPTSMKDMVETMVLMKQLQPEVTAPINPLQQIKDIVAIQQSISGSGNSSETNVNDVLLTLAENVLPKLAEAGLAKADEKTVDVKKLENSSVVNPVIDSKTTSAPEKANPMKSHLVFLCFQASMKKDPALYAELVLDNTPDDKLDELVSFIGSDNAVDNLIALHPPVAKHKEWFLKLSEEIMKNVQVVEEKPETEALTDSAETTTTKVNVSTTETNNGDIIKNS